MIIGSQNFRNFYFGNGVEYFFISKFYMLGFEAYKINPDFGYDLLVTNKAMNIFKESESREYYVQIKSSILIQENTSFWLEVSEFEKLISDENCILICAVYKPVFKTDPRSFYYDREGNAWELALETDWMENIIKDYHAMDNDLRNDSFKFNDFEISYFWLNNRHLRSLQDENCFEDKTYKNKNYKIIKIKIGIENNSFTVISNNDDESNMRFSYEIASEMKDLYYLLNDCRCKEDIEHGKLFMFDY